MGAQLIESSLAALASGGDGAAVTPSDTTVLAGVRALWVGTAGNLTLTLRSGDVVLKNVPSGALLALSPSKVKAATTAADIVAIF